MNTASIRFTRAHVPGFGLDREPVAIRTCARLRWRAHDDLTLPGLNRTRTPPAIQSDVNSSHVGNWRSQLVERCTPYVSVPCWLRRTFPRSGDTPSGFLKFLRAIQAPGSLLRFAFVDHCREPSNSISSTFQFAPVLSWSVLHDRNMQQKDARSHEQCTREYE